MVSHGRASATDRPERTSDRGIVISLIHGTFARANPWTSRDSPFAIGLSSRLNAEIVQPTFKWSGANKLATRRREAARLSAYIDSVAQRFPERAHIVIAHSHGGNVALQAFAMSGRRDSVAGLVCLNTPFLHVRRRNLVWLRLALAAVQPIVLAAVAGVASWWLWWRDMYAGQPFHQFLMTALVLLSLVAVGVALSGPYTRMADGAVAALEHRQMRMANLARAETTLLPAHLLCLSVPRDEAYLWLTAVDALTFVALMPLRVAPVLFCFAGAVGLLFWDTLVWVGTSYGSWTPLTVLIGCLGGSIILYFVGLLIMGCVLPLLRSHVLSYGEHPLDSFLLDIRVEVTPPTRGGFTAYTLPGEGWLQLRHSSLHRNPAAVEFVARWCRMVALSAARLARDGKEEMPRRQFRWPTSR